MAICVPTATDHPPVAMVFPRRKTHRSPGSPAATGGASPGRISPNVGVISIISSPSTEIWKSFCYVSRIEKLPRQLVVSVSKKPIQTGPVPGPVSGPGPGLPVRSEASCGGCEARPVQMEGPGHLGLIISHLMVNMPDIWMCLKIG